ncbi:hypothetical protein MPF19_16515 [Polaribacter sp. Z014]|uniref:hypothetical protein n=1 Tax=unclassified Polaribacter TaxID=196858 RepID=UPI00193B0E63|nr:MULTISPECIES: hypothetical protein [unclassified Polaribacter]MCL7765028.1 hypothetical protein [Polaribacter sp. Z014]QVY66843.1 hypothetical protein JOP69_06060 [Polaribacter sp. Q13]
MNASDVHTIAKALSKEEYIKLYEIIRSEVNPDPIKLKKKNKLPDFTLEDGLRYLLKNHITKTIKT